MENERKGRVLTQGRDSAFAHPTGGRNNYGSLILSALTGQSVEQLAKGLIDRGMDRAQAERLQKQIATGGEVDATLLDAEDQFFQDYLRIHAGPSLIAPPIAPERLERLVSENNALEPCVETMVTNIACTGYAIVHRKKVEADLSDEEKAERERLEEFLSEVYPRKSFQRTRKELRRDLHRTGNSYMVLERTALGELAFIRRAPAKSMRLIKLDDPVMTSVRLWRSGGWQEITTMRSERRYVQKIGTKLVYYKEYGASRDLHRVTGRWHPAGSLPVDQRAHEVIHDKDIEDVKSPYGMPRWISQLPSVLGSRMAEEHNLEYFQSGGVPPIMVFVTGGMVSDEVARAINDYLAGGSKGKQRGIAVEVPSSGDLQNEKAASVKVERFGSQDADSTFENYDTKNELRVRRSFRLPGIFLGMADSYNFATAHASYVVAEAQVFKPEREEEDERVNMTIMREIDDTGMWKFASNPLSVQDVNLQLRALQMLSTVRGVGVADLVQEISRIADLEVDVVEEYAEAVVGDLTGFLPLDMPGDGAEGGTQGQPVAGEGQTPANTNVAPDAPSPGVTSQIRNQIVRLATTIARAVRSYDDSEDETELHNLVGLKQRYEELPLPYQEILNRALAPVLYSAPFLSDATMADVAGGYAHAVFLRAEAKLKEERPQ